MIGILAFSEKGRALAREVGGKLASAEPVDYYDRTAEAAREYVAKHFQEYDKFLFIGAAGICVRMIAPHITRKDEDPAVVVMDELGRYAISLLSGHIGGANAFTYTVAAAAGAEPVITTATDINEKFAADVWATEAGCRIEDISKIRFISGALLAGEPVGMDPGPFPVEGELPSGLVLLGQSLKQGISVSLSGGQTTYPETLNVIPRIVSVGIGCRRGTPAEKLEAFVLETLAEAGISMLAVETIASIDLKKDEAGIRTIAEKYRIPFLTFTAEELMEVEGEFDHSAFVEKTTGADNVCERSCVRAGGGRLLIRKTARDGMTLAASIRDWRIQF